jgi:hypothetical protein
MESPDIQRIDGSLELEQDLAFQRRQWRIQRIAWVILLLIGLAALAGLLGDGPLSKATASHPSGAISVEYQRFEHRSAESQFRLLVDKSRVKDGQVRVWIDGDYLARLQVTSVTPTPLHVLQQDGRHVYVFASDGSGPLHVTLFHEHQEWGKATFRIGLADGPESVEIAQFVYP